MKKFNQLVERSENVLHGIPAAPGLYIGEAYVFRKEIVAVKDGKIDSVNDALTAFYEALEKSKKELTKIFNLAYEKMGEERSAIFEAQLMILDDPVLIEKIEKRIKEEKRQPEFIVSDEISKYQKMMVGSSESYMKERAEDIEDIKNRIVRNLQKKRWVSKITEDVIVVSEYLTPADTILFSRRNIRGYVTDRGGLTSHASIIARSLDIPAVVGTNDSSENIKSGDLIIVDGFHGVIFVNPDEEQLEYFKQKEKDLNKVKLQLKELRDKPAETRDGRVIKLTANVDVSHETAAVIANGGEGIGLFRSEQLIEELGEFPDEEQQYNVYNEIATRIYPDILTIRAFDVGGDKFRLFHKPEANPFLGLRGIRFLLDNEKIFRSQLRAVLRASSHKNIRFMLPMVATHKEIFRSKDILDEVRRELDNKEYEYDKNLELGIMVEVPSAAVLAEQFAEDVDFLSIGTNDLIQFMMAVDRGNNRVDDLYQEFHPAILKTLAYITSEGSKSGTPVSICGEMAADPLAVPFLVGIGLDSLSMSAAAIPGIKRIIRELEYSKAQKLAEECLSMKSEDEIIQHINTFFRENFIQQTRNIF